MKKDQFFLDTDIVEHLSVRMNLSLDSLAAKSDDPIQLLGVETQKAGFLKKFTPIDQDITELTLDAYIKFLDINNAMSSVNCIPFPVRGSTGMGSFEKILLRARSLIAAVLGDFDETEWFAHCKHSAGASIGVLYSDTSIEAKSKALTYTGGVRKWFDYYLSYDPQLKRALESFGGVYSHVQGSRATTVPKDTKKVRMICVEPTLNMFFQQGLMHCLATRLERVGLSFASQQDTNKMVAWKASITGSHATIDWSSASDTVSYRLVEFLFPEVWFKKLDTFSSRSIEILGCQEELHMFSTMGNACTFPVETLVFWSLAVAASSINDGRASVLLDYNDVSPVYVFGDDCIVETLAVQPFLDVMRSLGFQPNLEKTFTEGRFRESCGGDFFAGKDVRPYNLTGPSGRGKSHLQAWLSIIFNRIKSIAIRLCGPLKYIYQFWPVFDYIFSTIRDYELELFIVPTHYPDDSGFKLGIDFCRFKRYFSFRKNLSYVTKDIHGTVYFKSMKASYFLKKKTFSELRYWLAIKEISTLSPAFVTVRKRITYVVQKNASPWFAIDI